VKVARPIVVTLSNFFDQFLCCFTKVFLEYKMQNEIVVVVVVDNVRCYWLKIREPVKYMR